MLRTQSIRAYLLETTIPELAELYTHDMEVQVNVAQDGGERITGEYNGKTWRGWTDGIQTWKSIRIPYKANSKPEYNDVKMSWDLAAHAESIGMTGWDWVNKVSKWVAYDFDAIVGHADAHQKKLTPSEMEEIEERVRTIPWVTVRKSTSGNGLHLYVFTPDVPTATHTEHAALARSILGVMSAIAGYNFESKVDVCGHIMWVWHRKMRGTDGLTLLKAGGTIPDSEIPINWKDHVKIVKGRSQRTIPAALNGTPSEDPFTVLTARKAPVALDEQHRVHIQWLIDNQATWWWDADNNMLVTHTTHLKNMHDELCLEGIFDTHTRGSSEHNCFLFPMRNGAWAVRRYGMGVNEAPCWTQDGEGWTRCYFNKPLAIDEACRALGGLENTKGEFNFRLAEDVQNVATLLGANITYDPKLTHRESTIKKHKDGRMIVTIKRESNDKVEGMDDWIFEDKKYTKIIHVIKNEVLDPESNTYDDMVRHLVSENSDAGWVINTDGNWHEEPLQNIRMALSSFGIPAKEVTVILGSAIVNCWQIVNKPFEPEYPGCREWNRKSVQLAYEVSDPTGNLNHPTWDAVLAHCGRGIDTAVLLNPWCRANGITTGADYLKCWVANMLQHPYRHLPYLFFYSPEQNTGKSTFYESVAKLMTHHGHAKANAALKSQQGFNQELQGAVLCTIEEVDLNSNDNKDAYNRIKDWVTAREISIHPKGGTPFHIPNTTHWVQCANSHRYCPVFPGDTRITMINVKPIDPLSMIPAKEMDTRLAKEAPDFLAAIMSYDIPDCPERLGVPALDNSEKEVVAALNMDELQQFIYEKCQRADGHMLKFSEFFEQFAKWLPRSAAGSWSKIRVSKNLPPDLPKGRNRQNSQFYIGNLAWVDEEVVDTGTLIVVNKQMLDTVTKA